MMPAVKHLDPVLGVDVHIIQPPGPVPPLPVPHPHVGMVIDPCDYVPIIGSTVKVNGMHRAIAGTAGKALPPHIPIGGTFVKPPSNENEAFMGSMIVDFDGDAASYMALPSLSCQCIGMVAPFRAKKKSKTKSLVLPTSVMLPIPAGPPVLIGGPPTISIMALGMRVGMAALGAGLRRLGRSGAAQRAAARFRGLRQRLFRNMDPGFLKCRVLRAEPVDVVTGEVVVDQQDFSIPGRIPLEWNRHYGSRSDRVGICGHGWETPADARLEFDEDGAVTFRDGTAAATYFDREPDATPVMEPVDGGLLYRTEHGFAVRRKGGLIYHFPALAAGETEALVHEVQDLCGNWLRFERDRNGLLAVEESAGRRLKATSRGGLLLRLELEHPDFPDPHPLARFEYDEAGDLTAVYDALDLPYGFAYRNHRLVRHTDRNGLSFHYEYDQYVAEGRCVHTWGDGGLYDYRFEYGGTEGWTNFTDSLGHPWSVEFNSRQMMTKEIDPLGGVTNYEYDEVGRASAVVDPQGRRTEYEYDERGCRTRELSPDGAEVVAKYNQSAMLCCIIDARGNAWKSKWTKSNLLAIRKSPRGALWKYDYNNVGDLVSTTDPIGRATRFEHDDYGMVRSIRDPLGNSTRFSVDCLGNVISIAHANGGSSTIAYDAVGCINRIVSADGATTTLKYDGERRPSYVSDANGAVTEYRYAGLGNVSELLQPDGTIVRFAYDTEERLIAVVNEYGESIRLKHDAAGHLIEQIDYWGGRTEFVNDASGHLVEKTAPNGQVSKYRRDEVGRLIEAELDDGRVESYRYDLCGNLIQTKNDTIVTAREYDEENLLISETQDDFEVKFEYDLVRNCIRRNTSHGNEVDFGYDGFGRLEHIVVNGRTVSRIQRQQFGNGSLEALPGGISRESTYDAFGCLSAQRTSIGERTIAGRRYRFDPEGGLRARKDERNGVELFELDSRGRISTHTRDGQDTGFVDGGAPNRRSKRSTQDDTASPPDGGHLLTSDAGTYLFDQAGRLVERQRGDERLVLEWDGADRLARASLGDHADTVFEYDAIGRRCRKTAESGERLFRWAQQSLLSEVRENGEVREYLNYPNSCMPFGFIEDDGSVFYFDIDNVGLPHSVFSEEGEVVWAARFGPLGNIESISENRLSNPIRFPGQYYDEEISLSYNRYRYYDCGANSYISQDPLGIGAGVDLYSYSLNPWRWIDPLGLDCLDANVLIQAQRGNADVLNFLNANRGNLRFGQATRNEFLRGGSQADLSALMRNYDIAFDSSANYRNVIGDARGLRGRFTDQRRLRVMDSRQAAEADQLGETLVTNDRQFHNRCRDLGTPVRFLDSFPGPGGAPSNTAQRAAAYVPQPV